MSQKTSGVSQKPDKCRQCPFAAKGKGFCEDTWPENSKVVYIFDVPTGDDILEQKALSGGMGYFVRKNFIWDIGWKDDEVAITHVLRCKPENGPNGKPLYPTAWLGRNAEIQCRRYDEGLIKFDPNCFVCTVHPRDIRNVACYLPQIQADLTKAREFVKMGFRPAVLFGIHAIELYFPWAKNMGGIKNLRGHYFFGEYPWKEGPKINEERRAFIGG